MADWTDSIVGQRMAVDREFSERVLASEFSNQEWGLIMTATELEIENPEDPERARLVANTEKVPQILPELDNIRSQMGAMGGGGGSSSSSNRGGKGLFGSVKRAFGLGGSGGGGNDEQLAAAERLTQEYADELQKHLESRGMWDQVRIAYQE